MDERDLSRLLSALCDEDAQSEQIAWLDEAIQREDGVRQKYLEYLALHAAITQWFSEEGSPLALPVDLGAVFAAPPPAPAEVKREAAPASPPSLGRALEWRSHPIRFLATTSVLTLLMWFVWSLTLIPQQQAARISSPTGPPRGASVARLVRSTNVVWSPGSMAWRQGAWLQPGRRLELESGVIELHFASGAELLLAGPVQFQVTTSNAGHLRRGSLSAHVPAAARGFVINAARATVTDLGTDFDVEVDVDSHLRLAVFTGSVLVMPHSDSADSPADSRAVEAGAAVEVLKSGAIQALSVPRERLVKRPPPTEATVLLAHYQLGEDDPQAEAGRLAQAQTRDRAGAQHLTRHGAPQYAARNSDVERLCVDFPSPGGAYFGPARTDMADEWILDAWVRAESVEGMGAVVYHGNCAYNGYGIIRNGGQWSGLFGGVSMLNFGAPVVIGKWTHLTLTRFQGATRLYVDGMQMGQLSRHIPRPPQGAIMIGGCVQDPNQTFRGQIDDVRLLRPPSAP